MMCNNNKTNDDKLSFLRENFPFLKDDRLNKMYTLTNEGFDINLAIILSFFDISRGKILILRKSRREELGYIIDKLNAQEKDEAIISFAIAKSETEENRKITRYYLSRWNKKGIRRKEKMENELVRGGASGG
jgi:hypothetical protein